MAGGIGKKVTGAVKKAAAEKKGSSGGSSGKKGSSSGSSGKKGSSGKSSGGSGVDKAKEAAKKLLK
jgi:hypothetical protein